MNAADAVEEALVRALCAELKLDEMRAHYIAHCALEARFQGGIDMFGMDGKGLFARAWNDNTPEVLAQHFNWLCVPVINSDRQAANRHLDWFAKCRQLGLTMTTFDWKPKATNWQVGLQDAIQFTAAAGATVYVIDAEVEFFHQPDQAALFVATARQQCTAAGIKLGFTSYGGPAGVAAFPFDPFTKGTDVSIPQAYDSDFALNPAYPAASVAAYRQLGAPRIALGRALYRNDPPGTSHARWLQAAELQMQNALVPPGVTSVIYWPLAGHVPGGLLAELDRWHPPADSSVREVLTGLTPLGRFFRD